MNSIQIQDRRISLSGTILFHIALIAMLFLVKCDPPKFGGGGGNNGFGLEGYIALDVAGFGDSEYGFGEDYVQATAAQYDDPTVQEEVPAITDESATEAPSISNKPSSSKTNPKDNTKPDKPQEPSKPQPSSGLSNALDGLGKPSGSGNTQGSGQQGTQNGQVGKDGAIGGGGSSGTGGGQGGKDGTGNGPDSGPGTGKGSGVDPNGTWNLTGRNIKRFPSITGDSPGTGVVVVDIWVDKNGNVTKAIANSSHPKTTATNQELYRLAEKKAREATFSSSDKETQKGSITFIFK